MNYLHLQNILKKKLFITLLTIFCAISILSAQTQQISSRLIDANTKKPIVFANIYFQKTLKGTVSDIDGKFSINYDGSVDTLIISAIGYETKKFYAPKYRSKRLNIKLKSINIKIAEVKIKPKKTKAHELLRLINKHEKDNNTYYFRGIEGDEYNRVSIMFTGIDNKIKESTVFKKTPGALIYSTDSTCSVPVLMSEDVNHFLIPADGSRRTVKRLNEKKHGLDIFDGADMTDITDEMTTNQNFYKQFIPLFGKNFASPSFVNARFYYKMWVSDSTVISDTKRYKVSFRPKRKKDLAFNGYFWVEDISFAITEISVELSPTANINYIKRIKTLNIYEKLDNGKWYFKNKQTEIVLDYTPGTDSLKKISTYVSKVTSYRNIKFTTKNSLNDKLISTKGITKVPTTKIITDEEYWKENRFIALNNTEQQIYSSIDTLKENIYIRIFDKSINMFLTGYWAAGKIDFGPYLDFYRYNKIEGHRVTLTMRTSKIFSPNYTVGGFLGYGFRDEKIKYGINGQYKFSVPRYTVLGINAWSDIRKIGNNDNLSLIRENSYSSGEDNLISAISSRHPNDKLSKKQYANISLEHDIKKGVTAKLKLITSKTYEGIYVDFIHINDNGDSAHVNSIQQIATSINFRFSFKENYLDEYFKRIYLGNKYPVVNLNIETGINRTEFTQDPYLRFHATIKHKLRLGMGFFKYVVEAGKILGNVPFPMLEIHRGNESFGYARYNFNMLNQMEYASDTYVNLHSTYNFGGLIFNHLPLLKKLNLREVISFKGILGDLSNKHAQIISYPQGMTRVMEPYAEVGVGITNIGQYGRIEYVWRLSDTNKPDIVTEGVRFRFEVSF